MTRNATTMATTFGSIDFLHFFVNTVANMAANYIYIYICMKYKKSLWKDENSYGDGTWYMDSTLEELNNYACICLISICIINQGPNWKS